MGASPDAARAEVVVARDEVLAARVGLEDEVVRLEASARAAVDIPARLRREPVKVGGAAAGAAFLLLGGPKRILRGARRAIFGPDADLPKSMLPDEVEKTLRRMGSDGDRIRGTLEREFTKYLDATAADRRDRDLVGTASGLLSNLLKPASVRAGRAFAERLFDPDGPSFAEGLRKARARMDGTVAGGGAKDANDGE
ncbi:MAG: hypothetical protein L0227_10395 [Chloroflexi bacterium]|nr:hypothetical protein [Chloroflexota bacterium]